MFHVLNFSKGGFDIDKYLEDYIDWYMSHVNEDYGNTSCYRQDGTYVAGSTVTSTFSFTPPKEYAPDPSKYYTYGAGEYDMFGNGNPPGPNGSVPTGIDGVYIKPGVGSGSNEKQVYTLYYYNEETGTYDEYRHASEITFIPEIILGLKLGYQFLASSEFHIFGMESLERDGGSTNGNTSHHWKEGPGLSDEEYEKFLYHYLGFQKTSQEGVYYKDGHYYKYNPQASVADEKDCDFAEH